MPKSPFGRYECVRVTNDRTVALRLIIEPWAREYQFQPGMSYEVDFSGPESPHAVEVQDRDGALVLWGWGGSTYRLRDAAGVEVDASDPNNAPPPTSALRGRALEDGVVRQFAIPHVVRGSMTLIPARDAEAFLVGCEQAGARLLGIEGFRIVDGATVPDMGLVLDLTVGGMDPTALESFRAARRFLREHVPSDVLLEFTLAQTSAAGGK